MPLQVVFCVTIRACRSSSRPPYQANSFQDDVSTLSSTGRNSFSICDHCEEGTSRRGPPTKPNPAIFIYIYYIPCDFTTNSFSPFTRAQLKWFGTTLAGSLSSIVLLFQQNVCRNTLCHYDSFEYKDYNKEPVYYIIIIVGLIF